MSQKRVGVYPGTFDPFTLGHFDIVQRALKVVDHLIIGVADNAIKNPLFDVNERKAMVERDVQQLLAQGMSVEVRSFDELLIHFVRNSGANVIVRGLRAVSDFEYEFQMAGMNASIDSSIETIFLMASDKYQFIASRFIKEVRRLNGDISPFVSNHVAQCLAQKFSSKK